MFSSPLLGLDPSCIALLLSSAHDFVHCCTAWRSMRTRMDKAREVRKGGAEVLPDKVQTMKRHRTLFHVPFCSDRAVGKRPLSVVNCMNLVFFSSPSLSLSFHCEQLVLKEEESRTLTQNGRLREFFHSFLCLFVFSSISFSFFFFYHCLFLSFFFLFFLSSSQLPIFPPYSTQPEMYPFLFPS